MIGAGLRSLGVWNPAPTDLGTAFPFGGTVPLDVTQTDIHLAVTIASASKPEPATPALLSRTFACTDIIVRRRRTAI